MDLTALAQDDAPIYTVARDCDSQFAKCVASMNSGQAILREYQQQFWAWANNAGVFAEPFLSLDARLKGHPEPQMMILRLIELIHNNLEAVSRLDFENGSSKSSKAFSSRLSTIMKRTDDDMGLKHIEGPLYGIGGCMLRLNRIASAIFASSRKSLPRRIDAIKNRHLEMESGRFETLMDAVIQHNFPNIAPSLRIQLKGSIVYRRQRLIYQRHRRMRLRAPQEQNDSSKAQPSRSKPIDSAFPGLKMRDGLAFEGNIKAKGTGNEKISQSVTTFSEGEFMRQLGHTPKADMDARSTLSAWTGYVEYPPPPKARKDEFTENASPSECQFCGNFLIGDDMEDTACWRKHVKTDLEPFICISAECSYPPVGFADQLSWRSHMDTYHGNSWTRYVHVSGSKAAPEGPITALNKIRKEFETRSKYMCPLCETSVDNLPTDGTHLAPLSSEETSQPSPENSKKVSSRTVKFLRDVTNWSGHQSSSSSSPRSTNRGQKDLKQLRLLKHIAAHLESICFLGIRLDIIDRVGNEGESGGKQSTSCKSDGTSNFTQADQLPRPSLGDLDDLSLSFESRHDSTLDDFLPNRGETDLQWSFLLQQDGSMEKHSTDSVIQHFLARRSSQAIPSKAIPFEAMPRMERLDLADKLRREAIDHPHEEMGSFVPIDALKRLITQDAVVEELQRPNGNKAINGVSLDKIAEYVCHKHRLDSSEEKYTAGLKLFAILLLIEKPKAVTQFIAEGLRDKDLPFKLERKNGGFQLLRKSAPFDKIKAFDGWRHIDIETFERNQWSLLSPIFTKADKTNKVLHYSLESKILLPFVESDERSLFRLGDYETVFKVKIHSSHHSFDRPEGINPYFAVKKLFLPDEAAFHNEVETLKRFSINSHEHLIKLLATYKHMNRCHLIFPWADGNLRRFWKLHPKPHLDCNLALWTADQCHGLAVGLGKIHHYQSSSDSENLGVDAVSSSRRRPYGRYSNIKPENILWFKDYHSAKAFNGVLKISDFGLTQFNSRQSRSAMPAVDMGTYRPPECDMPEDRISQAWDMWALGCVYLEFIIWLLKGFQAVNDSFLKQRLSDHRSTLREVREDTFFVIENGAASLKRSVSSWIDQLHQDINCTEYLHDLLDFILYSLLNPSPLRRAKCPEVVEKLNNMRQKCRANEEYHMARVPKVAGSVPPGPYYGKTRKPPGEIPPIQKILGEEQY